MTASGLLHKAWTLWWRLSRKMWSMGRQDTAKAKERRGTSEANSRQNQRLRERENVNEYIEEGAKHSKKLLSREMIIVWSKCHITLISVWQEYNSADKIYSEGKLTAKEGRSQNLKFCATLLAPSCVDSWKPLVLIAGSSVSRWWSSHHRDQLEGGVSLR